MCKKVGLFFGSDSGATEDVAMIISKEIGEDRVSINDIVDVSAEDFSKYDSIILGLSTWYDGQLQSAWEEFYDEFKTIDFTDKVVAIFGLGDQVGYSEYYIDGVGIIGKVVEKNGGKLVGEWKTEGYEHEKSKADKGNGYFYGLALDDDNESDLTEERVKKWVDMLKNTDLLK